LELLSAILSEIDVLNIPWTAVTAHGITVRSGFFYFLFILYIFLIGIAWVPFFQDLFANFILFCFILLIWCTHVNTILRISKLETSKGYMRLCEIQGQSSGMLCHVSW